MGRPDFRLRWLELGDADGGLGYVDGIVEAVDAEAGAVGLHPNLKRGLEGSLL